MNTNLCKIVPLPHKKLIVLGPSEKEVFQICNTCRIGDTKPRESREGIISSDWGNRKLLEENGI